MKAHEGARWTPTMANVSELGIPEGVREAVRRRLSRLSDPCSRLLMRASAMTGGFSWNELKAISEESEEELLDLLDEALAAQLLVERAGADIGYDFTHAIIRHALYDGLSGPRRVLLHRQIAEALELLYQSDLDTHVGELAHHYIAAAGGDAEKAVEYSLRAGDLAMSQYAWEEAVPQYERGLHAIELLGARDPERRCQALLKLGDAQAASGQLEASLAGYRRAADIAREVASSGLLSAAAVGFENASFGMLDNLEIRREALALLDEALGLFGDEESPDRLRALISRIRPAAALASGGEDAYRVGGYGIYTGLKDPQLVARAREAVAMAQRVEDPALLSAAIVELHNLMYGPGTVYERLALITEHLSIAEACEHAGWELLGRLGRAMVLLELGDIDALRVELDEAASLATRTRQPWFLGAIPCTRAALAMAEGCFAEAEPLMFEALTLVQQVAPADAVNTFGAQLCVLRWLQGRLQEVEPMFTQAAEASPNVSIYGAALALIACELGRPDQARKRFERVAENAFIGIPEDFLWMGTMLLSADVCAALEDRPRAQALYDLLVPSAELNGSISTIVSGGAVSRMLGRLAGLIERWDDAEQHFEHALEMNARMEHWAWLAMTQLNFAQTLCRRGEPGDAARAQELLSWSVEAAERMGMARVAAACRELMAAVPAGN